MRNIADNRLFNMILLFTIVGEFFLPFVLEQFYVEYNGKIMVMSALGSPQSPVRLVYNLWLVWLGGFLAVTAWVYFEVTRVEFPVLSVFILLSIVFFAIGAGLISGVFSVNESKEMVTTASKIHGVGAAIGFMALLFFPLLNGIVSFKQKDIIEGIISISSFVLALIFFACFVMGDKEQFQNTILKYEGLWERFTLFCLYIPFIYKTIGNLLF
ncbi:MAG: DUF998 domain-containing protein [Lachnospiraceae bacterium]|nr:DUF998 domain-containing protein [Lachnospiraceae bacterium]